MFSFLKKIGCYLKSYKLKYRPSEETKAKYRDIPTDEAVEKYKTAKNDYIWLDVRTQAEYAAGHIPGAKLIPVDQLKERVHEVGPKDKSYMVCCHSGGRSAVACDILYEQGYRHLFNLPGGMSQWSGPKA